MIDLNKLAKFLVKAKKGTYASLNRMKIEAERPMHDELEFTEGDFYYRDSYVGFFQAPGMEEVRLKKDGKTVWTMAYSGGMLPDFQTDIEFAKKVFTLLKKALELVDEKNPFRGPANLKDGDWEYKNKINGDIKRFNGYEQIFFKNKLVFSQEYIGGIVIDK